MRARKTNTFELLEPRRLMTVLYPSPEEQYMVEMYNWARADPAAAADRYNHDLNEGPPWMPITTAAKQPLAINLELNSAARNYAELLLELDQFTHYANGTNPQSRMAAAGYEFTGPAWGSGESAALGGNAFQTVTQIITTQFSHLYIDITIADRGHRVNIFNPAWKEVGTGVVVGEYLGSDNSVLSLQDFAYSGTQSFLTGVAYTETTGNNFYTPGEQMAGATITAVRNSDGERFSTTTWSSGGYTLALPAGSYTVWGGGGTLGGWVQYDNVTIGSENVKRDFRPDYVNSSVGPDGPTSPDAFAQLSSGKLTINGTSDADVFSISLSGGSLMVTRNDETLEFTASNVTSIALSAGDGDDSVTFGAGISIATSVWGGDGNDSIRTGDGADILKGEAGNDTIFGGAGNDRLYGGDGDDSLSGENGNDRLYGNLGNDQLLGGSHNDSLFGDEGNDSLWGQHNNDLLDGRTGTDYISGGKDADTVDYSSRTAGLYVELAGNASQATGRSGETGENDNVLADVENINGGAGNDRLIGSDLANNIYGNAGNDTIYGYGGVDSLFGGDGKDRFFVVDSIRDRIDGGTGRDTVSGDLNELLIDI